MLKLCSISFLLYLCTLSIIPRTKAADTDPYASILQFQQDMEACLHAIRTAVDNAHDNAYSQANDALNAAAKAAAEGPCKGKPITELMDCKKGSEAYQAANEQQRKATCLGGAAAKSDCKAQVASVLNATMKCQWA